MSIEGAYLNGYVRTHRMDPPPPVGVFVIEDSEEDEPQPKDDGEKGPLLGRRRRCCFCPIS